MLDLYQNVYSYCLEKGFVYSFIFYRLNLFLFYYINKYKIMYVFIFGLYVIKDNMYICEQDCQIKFQGVVSLKLLILGISIYCRLFYVRDVIIDIEDFNVVFIFCCYFICFVISV